MDRAVLVAKLVDIANRARSFGVDATGGFLLLDGRGRAVLGRVAAEARARAAVLTSFADECVALAAELSPDGQRHRGDL